MNKGTRFLASALAVALISSQLSPKRANAQAQVLVPTGAAIVIIAGIAYYVWLNFQGVQQTVPVSNAIMHPEDDEAPVEWDDSVSAIDQDEAEELCQKLANDYGVTLLKVLRRSFGNTYDCYFRSHD